VNCFDLQTAVPTATADISNCSYKANYTYNFTVYDLQMEALSDVHCYLWHGVRGKISYIEILYQAYCSTWWGGSLI